MTRLFLLALISLPALALIGCGSSPVDEGAERRGPVVATLDATTCGLPADVTAVLAWSEGLVFARPVGDELRVQRMRGAGCALAPAGAPVAAGALLDVDDDGALYVFPAEAASPDEISTMLDGEYPESMVARVDPGAVDQSGVHKLLSAGRGIWSFGVSPAGDALWVTACGPTGLFSVTTDGAVPSESLVEPETLWAQVPAVLTDAQTFWSVGTRTCSPSADAAVDALTDDCGFELVRTTPDGDTKVAQTVVDFGAGFEQGTLSRCGADVCGVFASAVVVWNRDGDVRTTITRADLEAHADEHIVGATGNRHGIYVTLRSARGTRVELSAAQRSSP